MRRMNVSRDTLRRHSGQIEDTSGTSPEARFELESGEVIIVEHSGDRLTIRSLTNVGLGTLVVRTISGNMVTLTAEESA